MTATVPAAPPVASPEDRRKLMARLARVEGQLRGVRRMIESGDSCERVAQQLAAARGALNKAFLEMLACAFEAELGAVEPNDELHEKVQHLTRLLARYG